MGGGGDVSLLAPPVSLHAGSGLCRSRLLPSSFHGALWRALVFLISASLLDKAVHEVMEQREREKERETTF